MCVLYLKSVSYDRDLKMSLRRIAYIELRQTYFLRFPKYNDMVKVWF